MTGPATWDGDGIDPWLPHRLAAESAITQAELRLYNSWWGSFSSWLVGVRRSVLSGTTPDASAVWAHAPAWAQTMTGFVNGPVKDTVGLAFDTLFGEGYAFDARPAVSTYLTAVHNRMVRTPDDVFDVVATSIARGAGQGLSIPDVAALVDHTLASSNVEQWQGRAVTVARTETIGALNFGRSDAFAAVAAELGDQFGEVLEQQWLATLDRRTRDDHAAADGQRVPVGTAFDVGGEPLQFPGDPSGSAAQVINCRCTTLLVRPGEELDMTGRGFTDADEWWADQLAEAA